MNNFFNLYRHGFIRAAVAIPEVRVADPTFNTSRTLEMAREAAAQKAVVVLFPELGIAAYSNEDLFHQQALLESVEFEIGRLLHESATLEIGRAHV